MDNDEHKVTMPWYRDWVPALVALTVLGMDQFTKHMIKNILLLGESWPTKGVLRITHGLNTGTAFGFFPDQTVLLAIISLFGIGFVIYFYKTQKTPTVWIKIAVGLILGGAVGNLIDRLRDGAVVDFISVGWWPSFNVADSSIVIGMTILVAVYYLGNRSQAKRMADQTMKEHLN